MYTDIINIILNYKHTLYIKIAHINCLTSTLRKKFLGVLSQIKIGVYLTSLTGLSRDL